MNTPVTKATSVWRGFSPAVVPQMPQTGPGSGAPLHDAAISFLVSKIYDLPPESSSISCSRCPPKGDDAAMSFLVFETYDEPTETSIRRCRTAPNHVADFDPPLVQIGNRCPRATRGRQDRREMISSTMSTNCRRAALSRDQRIRRKRTVSAHWGRRSGSRMTEYAAVVSTRRTVLSDRRPCPQTRVSERRPVRDAPPGKCPAMCGTHHPYS